MAAGLASIPGAINDICEPRECAKNTTRTVHFVKSIFYFCVNREDSNQVTKFRGILSLNRREIEVFYN